MKITHAASLTNPQLTAELGRLAHAERQATVALIVHLAEFDAGGKATVENIELRCGPHNRHEAERFYGPGKHRGGVDVVSESTAVYGMSPVRLPVPGRVAMTTEGGVRASRVRTREEVNPCR